MTAPPTSRPSRQARRHPELHPLAVPFFERFPGLDRAHGRYVLTGAATSGVKHTGKGTTKHTGPTVALWDQHLRGTYGLGVVPIRADNTCRWGCIDVDRYTSEHHDLEAGITKHQLPLVLCRSKSGGAHVFCFTSDDCPAGVMRGRLIEWATLLGVPRAEVFPKQVRLASAKDFGNWLNMPYFGGDGSLRHALRDGQALEMAAFLALSGERAVTATQLADWAAPAGTPADDRADLLEGAPPCLVALAAQGGIPRGERNNGLFALGVYVRKRFGEEWKDHLDAYRERYITEPLPASEVADVRRSLGKKDYNFRCNEPPIAAVCDRPRCLNCRYGIEGDTAKERELQALNQQFAQVLVGGRVGVMRLKPFEESGKIVVLRRDDFRALLAGQRLPNWREINGREHEGQEKAIWWLAHPGRRVYEEGLVFAPECTVPPGCLNLWRGFTLPSDPAPHPERRCARFLEHLQDHVAQGDAALYAKVVGWFAQMMQVPAHKLGTSLVLRGAQGTGKTIIGEVVGRLLGPHWKLISDPRYLVGQFNGHLANLLLLQCDEGFWAGDKRGEGRLKDLITGHEQFIELKGHEPFSVANHVRLLVTSNNAWVVPAALDDRRFIILDVVNTRHANDRTYFGAMVRELEHGGYAALLAHLLAYDWRAAHPEVPPDTAARAEQKEHGLSHEVDFLYAVVQRGCLPGDHEGRGETEHDEFFAAFTNWMKQRSLGRTGSDVWLTRAINEFLIHHGCAPLGETRPRTMGARLRIHAFPPRQDVCAAFARALGHVPECLQGEAGDEPWGKWIEAL